MAPGRVEQTLDPSDNPTLLANAGSISTPASSDLPDPTPGFLLLCIPVHPAYALLVVVAPDPPPTEARKDNSTITFCAGVFADTSTLTSGIGRLRRQFFSGVKETTAGVAGGEGLRDMVVGGDFKIINYRRFAAQNDRDLYMNQ